MYSFFFLNIFIIFTGSTSMYVTLYNQSLLFFFSAGFFYFQILCNIIYATTFIFLHTKTFGRILTETMTKSFVNVDMKRSGIAVLYSILGLFLVNGYFGIIDTWTAIALATTAGSAIVSTEYFY